MNFDDTNNKIKIQELNNNEFDSFFMHSLFDPYIYNGEGGNSIDVAKKFFIYLEKYLI